MAKYLADKLEADSDFVVLNKVEINSVAFMYLKDINIKDIERLNQVNKKIHNDIIEEGKYHLHQFSIPDSGKISKGEIVYPQRFMCGNPNTTKKDVDAMVEYVRRLGKRAVKELVQK